MAKLYGEFDRLVPAPLYALPEPRVSCVGHGCGPTLATIVHAPGDGVDEKPGADCNDPASPPVTEAAQLL